MEAWEKEIRSVMETRIANAKWARGDYARYLQSPNWKEIRLWALGKFGHSCMVCGCLDGINVHHRTYEHLGDEWHHMDDLIVLCEGCHAKVHDKLPRRR